MIILNKTKYTEVTNMIDNDDYLSEDVKKYIKEKFDFQVRTRITREIAQIRMNAIKGRENYKILKWSKADEYAIIKMDCGHILTFERGCTIYSEYNNYGGWSGNCPKCRHEENLQDRIEKYGLDSCYEWTKSKLKELGDYYIREDEYGLKNCYLAQETYDELNEYQREKRTKEILMFEDDLKYIDNLRENTNK